MDLIILFLIFFGHLDDSLLAIHCHMKVALNIINPSQTNVVDNGDDRGEICISVCSLYFIEFTLGFPSL
jgi:hypothetical protein